MPMEPMAPEARIDGPRTILFVDDAIAFGGSLIVSSLLVKHLDPSRYRAVVVGEADRRLLDRLFSEKATVYRIPRAVNYADTARFRRRLQGIPFRPVRRLGSYALTVVEGFANVPYHFRLATVILREGVDVIHQSNGAIRAFFLLFPVRVMATLASIPTVDFNRIQRWVLSHYDAFVMISLVVKENFVRAGGLEELTRLVPNPTEPSTPTLSQRKRIRERYGIPAEAKVFGIVGRVIRWKGQKEFLAAAELVLDRVPDALAVIIGDASDAGPQYSHQVQSLAADSAFADRIVFTGYIEDMEETYSLLDVAVHASIEPEPFGLVIIEAMGHGIPIVAADLGAPPEIVEHGVDGYLVDPTDARAMASKLIGLLEDDRLRRSMGERGKQKVETQYSAQQYAVQIQEIYDQILNDGQDDA